MRNKLSTRSEPSVTQANDLIRAAYCLTLNEKRLILLAISKLNPLNEPDENKEGAQVLVNVDEWSAMLPGDLKPYQSIRRASESLLDRKWRPLRNDRREGKYNWLSHCIWDKDARTVEMGFTYETTRRLKGLTREFTRYSLKWALRLGGPNRVRVYEFLSQYKATGYLTIKLAELREMLVLEDKYPKWAEFQRQVIKPAVDEINKLTDIRVTYEPFRKSREVAGIEFYIQQKRQSEMPLKDQHEMPI